MANFLGGGITGIVIHHARVKTAVTAGIAAPLMACGMLVEREAKQSMRKGGGKARAPSAPGTPPHIQTGALRSSITTAPHGLCEVVVGPIEPYGQVHEYGGRHHPQRPFMRPAMLRAQSKFAGKFRHLKLRERGVAHG